MNNLKLVRIGVMLIFGVALQLISVTGAWAQTCGDGNVDPGEACDNGSQSGGCCTEACTTVPAGTPCIDGIARTVDACNTRGQCIGRYPRSTDCTPPATFNPQTGACAYLPEPPGCGNGTVDPGETCDLGRGCYSDPSIDCTQDPQICGVDACDPRPSNHCCAERCGDGVVEAGEACDNGSRCADGRDCSADASVCGDGSCQSRGGNCCSSTCTFASSGTTCDDGNGCTLTDRCDGSGLCVGTGQPHCDGSDACHAQGFCNPATGTCGTCRDPNDQQDRSYCDIETGQCVTQIDDCPLFEPDAGISGGFNLCRPWRGERDPATGTCRYTSRLCAPRGCKDETCIPETGECVEIPTLGCDFSDSCSNGLNCVATTCRASHCSAFGDSHNCDSQVTLDCVAHRGVCDGVGVDPDDAHSVNGCVESYGCTNFLKECAPPANPCEVLVHDASNANCCTYVPRDCAAEFGNNPHFIYGCEALSTLGICNITGVNDPPSVTGLTVAISPGFVATRAALVSASDDHTDSVALRFTLTSVPTGITFGPLGMYAGTIKADMRVACSVEPGRYTAIVEVADVQGLKATALVAIDVTLDSDLDHDHIGDTCDLDVDGDGDLDATDCAPLDQAIHHGAVEVCDGIDTNCNGTIDEGFTDTDGDALADCVDPDDDGDGTQDTSDNCPLTPNLDQADSDHDGAGDACDARVAINEVHYDQASTEQEFIELFAVSGRVDLTGWTIADLDEMSYAFGQSLNPAFPCAGSTFTMEAGDRLVVWQGAGTSVCTGASRKIYLNRVSFLQRDGDDVVLRDAAGACQDYVALESGASVSRFTPNGCAWTGPNPNNGNIIGRSISRFDFPFTDTDSGSDWERSGTTTTTAPKSAGSTNVLVPPIACRIDMDCRDQNPCTDGTCQNPGTPQAVCVQSNNTASCDDGNSCTAPDTCSGGTCTSGPNVCAATVVVTEVHYDQASGEQEFIELLAVGGSVTLDHWTISDQDELTYKLGRSANPAFPCSANPFTLNPGERLVIWQGAGTSVCTGASRKIYFNRASFLQRDGDDVVLKNAAGSCKDYVAFENGSSVNAAPAGCTWTGPNPNNGNVMGRSISRRDVPPTDTDRGGDWEGSGGVNTIGPTTPGARNSR